MINLLLNNISYSYNGMTNVLQDISLELKSGSVYAILGPSGTGKTTLLSLIGGLDFTTKGEMFINDTKLEEKDLGRYRKDYISFIFQSYNLIDYMNAEENVELTSKEDEIEALRQVGLTDDLVKRNVLKLSGGQQQRVAIARALAADSDIILADEPTGNLDEQTASEITSLLKRCAHEKGKCVVIVTHSNEIANEADFVFRISRGTLM